MGVEKIKKVNILIPFLIIILILPMVPISIVNSDDIISIDNNTSEITQSSHGPSWNKYLKDGKWIFETSTGLINYNDNGEWKPIDVDFCYTGRQLGVIGTPYILKVSPDKSYYRVYPDRNNLDKWVDVYMPDIRVLTGSSMAQIKQTPFFSSPSELSTQSNSLSWSFKDFGSS